ncbi:MAG: hypothetical protein A3H95_04475 [Acidobacteria bacterium RIFCSPLOWO2_02_FULL_64_15]|nr:MAG: hypothetical protein A3H95_04475 [Acidobacteria bacterium RIFCSPLOWO2_02_FULL_64_15]
MVAVTCLMTLPLMAAIGWDASRTRLERAAEVRDQAAAVATAAAAAVDQYFASLDAMASVLVRHPAIRALDGDECNRLLAALLVDQPLVANVSLRDRNGVVRAAGAGLVDGRPQQVPAPPHVLEVLATGRPTVTDFAVGQVSGRPTVFQAYPVRGADDSVIGVINFAVNVSRLQQVFESIALPEGSVVTLVDRQSRVLVRSVDGERFIGTAFDERAVEPKDVPRTFTRTGGDGIDRLHANAVVGRGPWLLSVGIPQSVVAAHIAPLWRRDLIVGLSAIGGVLLLVLWPLHHTSRGLEALRSSAQRIAGGDLTPPARGPAPNLEIAQLQDAFVTMATNLREARDALDFQIEQERKMRETLQSLQRQVVRQERLAAVGTLVSGVAHELNNPLQAILGVAELMECREGLGLETLDDVALIKTQGSRAREIIRSLSRFGSHQSGPPALVDLREVITEVIQLRRPNLESSSIALEVDSSCAQKVYANVTEIERVLLNFVVNAQQAIDSTTRPAGRIVIRLSHTGKKVRVEVHDDGPGVPAEYESKLFQPFFTTKSIGQGTGLGLSVSYGIIHSYGGTVGHSGNQWGGATFFFELPVADVPAVESVSV